MGSVASDAELVLAARTGDGQAFTVLFERWFDRSYDVAWRIVRNRDTAAEVAQDTFLTAWTKLDSLRDPEAFGGWVLRSARNRALNRLEREGRSMAFDTDDTVGLIDHKRSAADVADDIVRQEQHDLVWAAAQALGERDASILDLHLRHDLGPAEIAEALDIAPNAAHQTLFRLRKRLEGAIRSYVLWQDGEPDCDLLAQALISASVESFGPRAVKTISSHVASCEACERRHSDILAPASMFAAVPLVLVGLDVRSAAAAELISHGVPIDLEAIGDRTEASAAAEDSRGLWQINTGSRGPKVAAGALVATLLVMATVVGAGLLGGETGGNGTIIEVVAAPGTTDQQPRSLGSTPAPTTGEADLVDPPSADAPPSSTEAPLADPTTSTAPPTTTAPPRPTEPPPVVTTTTRPPVDTTSTTVTTAPPRAPRFAALRVAYLDVDICGRVSGRRFELIWDTIDADHVVIQGPGVTADQRSPGGLLQPCIPGFDTAPTWQLTAHGPGGTTSTSITWSR